MGQLTAAAGLARSILDSPVQQRQYAEGTVTLVVTDGATEAPLLELAGSDDVLEDDEIDSEIAHNREDLIRQLHLYLGEAKAVHLPTRDGEASEKVGRASIVAVNRAHLLSVTREYVAKGRRRGLASVDGAADGAAAAAAADEVVGSDGSPRDNSNATKLVIGVRKVEKSERTPETILSTLEQV